MYIEIKSQDEILAIEESAAIARQVLFVTRTAVTPGISTKEIEEIAVREMDRLGAKSAFWNYRGYPAQICISINDELVHGIPSTSRKIKDGDLVKLDIGIKYKGYYGDVAETIPVGNVSKGALKLLTITYNCFNEGLKQAYPGKRLGDMAFAVQSYVEKNGFSVIRQFVGHGIGRNLHEKPEVPNFGTPGEGSKFEPGMVFAFEPMVATDNWQIKIKEDGWTAVTVDDKPCAHFEKMVSITEKGPVFLADFEPLFLS
ncbi:MAG: type I methionyl aminopeptidase [Elusimicrobiota bacterium]